MDEKLNLIRDEAYRKGLKDGGTKWSSIDTDTPKDKMLLLANDYWIPSKRQGEPPVVKIGYYFSDENRWVIFGASWTPSRWAEIPYPEKL